MYCYSHLLLPGEIYKEHLPTLYIFSDEKLYFSSQLILLHTNNRSLFVQNVKHDDS